MFQLGPDGFIMQYVCVCVCVCALRSVLCAVCCVLCAVGCCRKKTKIESSWSFALLWPPKTKENKNKKQEQKKETKERSKKKKRKVWVWGGVGLFVCLAFFWGGWCALYITCFFFLTAFPTRCQCRGALLASHAAWRKYLTTFNLVGGAAPNRMKMDSNCAQLHG